MSLKKANPDILPVLEDAFVKLLFPMKRSAVPYQEFMDSVFRQDSASFKRLLQRRCHLDRRETWGNVFPDLDPNYDAPGPHGPNY